MIKVDNKEIPEDIHLAKKWWRKEIRTALKALSQEYMDSASAAICDKLRSTAEYAKADVILLYVSAGREVITAGIIEAAAADGKKVCLPKCLDIDENGKNNGLEHEMNAREYNSPEDLSPGAYGIMEPRADSVVVPAEEIDMIVLPCMGCAADCSRLGHGAGYYDRYLELVRDDCKKFALCYEEILAETLPTENHDVPMDAVVTESKIYYSI